ncbi:MAG: hypothetical protein ACK5ZC_10480 [Pirellulaceae bacterium]|jgi:hypothetical protein
MMKRYSAGLILLLATASGCGICKSIEQWKCDNLGMCHFGTSPSSPYNPYGYGSAAPAPGVYPSTPGSSSIYGTGALQAPGTPGMVVPGVSGVPGSMSTGTPGCSTCGP